jgi:deoxyribodipyrimidine photolyase-related protein
MALYADGGVLASKPYAAGGAYINRMSNYCAGCRFDPKKRTGEDACPFTTLYWDFLMRQEKKLAGNVRMAMPYRTLSGMSEDDRAEIRARADAIRNTAGKV